MDYSLLDEIIIGRVEPHIYAFSTNTIPNYLKVGDTYRPVAVRLKEWEAHYPALKKEFDAIAKIDDVYFRDFAVHKFLETEKSRIRLMLSDISTGVYYSKEFFKDASVEDLEEAIDDIKRDFSAKTQKYSFYNAETLKPEDAVFRRTENYPMRPNQEDTVEAFKKAIANGHHNLLMYAVMRFGKSFTSMCCAVANNANLVVVVSAKADVLPEWKKTVESHVLFADYDFISAKNLSRNNHLITEKLSSGKKVVVFLTLQDLQGKAIKDKHQEVFGQDIDLLLVDETHFGARAEKYGEVLKGATNYVADAKNKKDADDFVEASEADAAIKVLKAKNTIHLSGTPYRILMGSEFSKEDIIAFYQFTDIVNNQKKWDEENFALPEEEKKEDWENPYYGFPQMVRFAFVPNESSRKKLESLRTSGTTYAFSALFKPKSIKKADDGSHKLFENEEELLELFSVIDGSKEDDCLLGFLDYDKIKEGKMCRHMVIVLPYCASCDALEALIKNNEEHFKNLGEYEIVNISGVDNPNKYKSAEDVKQAIAKFESESKKTITLTVNRMLTGSTVREWDTMLFFKDTASPQEYDQAVFRLQNQYVTTYTDSNGHTIKFNMKPQTLLVDFDPNRMFAMQERKSKIYNANVETSGNTELEKRIRQELEISPIIMLNKDKIVKVVATDILEAVSNYQKDKGIKDEALEVPVDLNVLKDDTIRSVIERENEIGSKSGLSIAAHEQEDGEEDGSDIDIPDSSGSENDSDESSTSTPVSIDEQKKKEQSLSKKIQSYYARILLFAFITKDTVISLADIIAKSTTEDNARIIKNLGLNVEILSLLNQRTNKFVLSDLDYKIQNLNKLSNDDTLSPAEKASVAINKFGKLGDAIVVTPSKICDDMVSLIPDETYMTLSQTNGKVLDIAGTAGEYAVALYKKMRALGVSEDVVKNSIYTIPKSPVCYELTRKLYEMLGLNVANIAKEFIATDLLEVKNGNAVDYDQIKALLTQNKPFDTIKLTDNLTEGENDMIKFEAIVGNPPYQEVISSNKSNKSLSKQLFPFFIKMTIMLNSTYVALITPSRWFTGDAQDGSFIKLRDFIKSNNHIKTIKNYPIASNVFPDVFIAGGVNYYLYDKNYSGKVDFSVCTDNKIVTQIRNLFEEGLDIIVNSSENYAMIQKLRDSKFVSLTTITKGRDAFGITGKNANNISSVSAFENAYELRCAHEEIRYVSKDKITKNIDIADKWKIFISKGNGGAGTLGDGKPVAILGKPYIGKAKSVCTDSLIPIGAFDTKKEAINLQKYIKTKFLRYMVGILKVSQNVYQNVYQFVPLQDFTDDSDIDWSKSVAEIDQQLYEKYNLDDSEIAFIESMIKPME
jgi:thiol-disulfide isomerase/thioredoxin